MSLPVTIPLRPSRRLALLLALVHLAALAVAWSISLDPPYMTLLAAGIVASALHCLRRFRHPAVAVLHLGKTGELEIETKVGACEPATVLPQTAVLSGLIVLLLRRDGSSRTLALALPTDATGYHAHRQLRLWLKWQTASS